MNPLVDLAADVLAEHGWRTTRQLATVPSSLEFDLVAESEAAIAFFETVSGSGLRRKADVLAANVASVTLQADAGVKAWEAYLVLLVTDEFSRRVAEAQEVQRDLSYCRKIVLDGGRILAANDAARAMEAELAFLFPLTLAPEAASQNVRARLVQLVTGKGHDEALVRSLVDTFDSEPDCNCWPRIRSFAAGEGSE